MTATHSGAPSFGYSANEALSSGLMPAGNGGCVGFGANPALFDSAPGSPGAPPTILIEAIGGEDITLIIEGGSVGPGPGGPSLDFSFAENSQYIPLLLPG